MDQKEYLKASERTEKKFPEGLELTGDNQVVLNFLMSDLSTIGKAVDHVKRHLIYGADMELKPPQSDFTPNAKQLSNQQAEMLHAALGKVTEGIEFIEMVTESINANKGFDVANALEEVGDGMWYDAMVLRLIGSDFDNAAQINIDKLTARFPEKFTQEAALNRDLDTERQILEDGVEADASDTFSVGLVNNTTYAEEG